MDPGKLALFRLAEQRLAWLDRRQEVLAQNIANADTPGYAARDLPAFAKVLARAAGPAPARTDPRHLAGTLGPAPRARPEPLAAERTPAGNAVQIERELVKVSDTETHHSLTLGLMRKYLSLFRIALGRQG
ncbi:flagellar biosynthesis protein FlgB [Elioraea sp. Yellowstone]|jgi:flagellar basal-body rod protein FlgB|uniref:flagellar basal body rod protein FlgB n=1 Tax=Elioraea sp. Yellowstone TaxID=2592070 RepID=UPI001154A85D|nr:flagellar basal body protein [Elioraea sp. Yellowstone]TQF81292.1 flagellar biosynthesis protein FlgB [Elioraea sp. Yellowstone]